eukprot:TRINITY_DN23829_c0_g1_i1.p1 TRINITY_DN23829_c0_g1~~TRINITY_DN23829_c0_g1_i1.p1  ORF type:complete len:180 (+),score=54.81 TRINITY_DN23829_c0_g1_i1:216-755(+)
MPALKAETTRLLAREHEEVTWLHAQLGPHEGAPPELRDALVEQHKSTKERLMRETMQLRLQLEDRIATLQEEVHRLTEAQAHEREWLSGQLHRKVATQVDTPGLRELVVAENTEDKKKLEEEREEIKQRLTVEIEVLREDLASKVSRLEEELSEKDFELELARHKAQMPEGYENRYLGE